MAARRWRGNDRGGRGTATTPPLGMEGGSAQGAEPQARKGSIASLPKPDVRR